MVSATLIEDYDQSVITRLIDLIHVLNNSIKLRCKD